MQRPAITKTMEAASNRPGMRFDRGTKRNCFGAGAGTVATLACGVGVVSERPEGSAVSAGTVAVLEAEVEADVEEDVEEDVEAEARRLGLRAAGIAHKAAGVGQSRSMVSSRGIRTVWSSATMLLGKTPGGATKTPNSLDPVLISIVLASDADTGGLSSDESECREKSESSSYCECSGRLG